MIATATAVVMFVSISIYLGTMTSLACMGKGGTPRADDNTIFSPSYIVARHKFLESAQKTGSNIHSIRHPDSGPNDEPLYIDVAYYGSSDDTRALVILSGTHGVEGFAGSAIQTGALLDGITTRLPSGTSLIMIHALNPYGMAHIRRFTEGNVDLNRNFRNHSSTPPDNLEYNALANAIAPSSISFRSEVISWGRMIGFILTQGKTAFQKAVSSGQYAHPSGLFYGSRQNTWSNDTLRTLVQRYLYNRSRVVIIDVHTGLGARGNAEIIKGNLCMVRLLCHRLT